MKVARRFAVVILMIAVIMTTALVPAMAETKAAAEGQAVVTNRGVHKGPMMGRPGMPHVSNQSIGGRQVPSGQMPNERQMPMNGRPVDTPHA